MDLTQYRVRILIYPYAEYRFGHSVPIIDEGFFYRIDNTHIIDKFKIKDVVIEETKVKVTMTDETVILEVES